MKTLEVFLDEDRIGGLVVTGNDATFTYDSSWRLGNSTPLSLSMPLTKPTYRGPVVRSFFDGLLPDNDDTRKRWGREFGVSSGNVFALAASVGRDLPGAVGLVSQDEHEPTSRTVLTDDDIALQLKTLRKDVTAWHFTGAGGQFSLAGAQGKMALALDEGKWSRPGGDEVTTHIVKPGVAGVSDSALNEHLCLRAAAFCGLTVAETAMRRFADEPALVATRFDRWRGEDRVYRIHQEDACQALGVPTTSKYQADGGPSAADIAALLKNHVQPHARDEDLWRFIDALLFNWMIAGTDAHGKNYAFLLRQSQVRLAPLYDIASLLTYSDVHPTKRFLAMSIGGEYRISMIKKRHWVRLSEQFGVDPLHVLDRADELAELIPNAFKSAASEADASFAGFANKLAELVGTHVDDCRDALHSPA